MTATARVPILHIADAVLADLERGGATPTARSVCLRPQPRSRPASTRNVWRPPATFAPSPPTEVLASCVLPAIALVKRNPERPLPRRFWIAALRAP